MFGKPRDIHDPDTLDTSALDEFFGDGSAAENTVEIHELRERVEQVEAQISSQFTSLATYAQIAQEQVELARSEAKAATERSEQRLTSLIERERADRITSFTGVTPDGAPLASPEHSSEATSRLDALEESVARITEGPRPVPPATEGPRTRDHRDVRLAHRVDRPRRQARRLHEVEQAAGAVARRFRRGTCFLPCAVARDIGRRAGDVPCSVTSHIGRRADRRCRRRLRRADRRPRPQRLTAPNVGSGPSPETKARHTCQRTISMRMPVSSQNGSSGMRLIARPDARRAVNSSAAACNMCTDAAPSGGVRVTTSSTPGRR
jgi:hypothetical protein